MSSIDRANKAKAVLENPLFEEAFTLVRASLHDLIENLPLAEIDQAEDARKSLKLLAALKLRLITAINTGKLEEAAEAEKIKRLKNPLRGMFR